MIGRSDRSEKVPRGQIARSWIRSSFIAWIAVLALVFQLGATAAPRATVNSGQAEAVAAIGALSALLGPNVALCLHEDGSAPGSPGHDAHDCCADCALCQHAGQSAALVPPSYAVPIRFARFATRLNIPREASAAKPRLTASAQPRAPPIFA